MQRRPILLGSLGLVAMGGVAAQADFPARSLKIIVPQPPGGGFDFVGAARTIKQRNAHTAARQEQGRGAAHHACANDSHIKARLHIGAGAGTGISA